MDEPKPPAPPSRLLAARALFAFAAVALLLGAIGIFGVLMRSSKDVGAIAHELGSNAAPSIVHLSRATAALDDLQGLLRDEEGADRPPEEIRGSVNDARLRARRHLMAYLGLPRFAGERELWPALVGSFDRLDAAAIAAMDAPESAEPGPGRRERYGKLFVAAREAGRALNQVSEVNATEALHVADTLERERTRVIPLAIALEVTSSVAALLAIAGAAVATRRALRLQAAALAESRSLAAELEAFAGRVAHDLVSPLAAVTLGLSAVDRALGDAPPPAAQRALLRARSSVERVRALATALLEFARAGARPQVGAMATVGPALEDAFEVARPGAEAANIDLRASHVDEVAPVACPPGVLASVLNNLVQNAVKYMGTSPERVVEVVAEERGDDVEIAVRDTGPGISPEMQKRIFEPFVRATAGAAAGVGLGLSIVRRMVEAYGGAVAVTSQPGRGTTFRVRLPRADVPVHG